MQLSDLANRHPQSTVWICGTGPSLELATSERIGDAPRILLNRAAFVMDTAATRAPGLERTYWLVLDDAWALGVPGPWTQHLEAIKAGEAGRIAVLRNPLLGGRSLNSAPAGNNIVHFAVRRGRDRETVLGWDREHLAREGQLYERLGSAATAVHLAWYLGARRIVLAGIDGGTAIEQSAARFYRADEQSDHDTARRWALAATMPLGLEVEDLSTAAMCAG